MGPKENAASEGILAISLSVGSQRQLWRNAIFPTAALHTLRITAFFRAQALKNMLNIEWATAEWEKLAALPATGNNDTMRNTALIKTILKPVKTHSPDTRTYVCVSRPLDSWQRPSAFGCENIKYDSTEQARPRFWLWLWPFGRLAATKMLLCKFKCQQKLAV